MKKNRNGTRGPVGTPVHDQRLHRSEEKRRENILLLVTSSSLRSSGINSSDFLLRISRLLSKKIDLGMSSKKNNPFKALQREV